MKHTTLILLMLLLLGCADGKNKQPNSAPPLSKGIPELQELDGSKIDLADFKGKTLVINLWATWCLPCIKEMPSLVELTKKIPEDQLVLLVATDQKINVINKFIENKGLKLHFVQLKNSMESLGVYALPMTFIYDKKGNEVQRIEGTRDWAGNETLDLLTNIL